VQKLKKKSSGAKGLMMEVLEVRIGLYGYVLEINRKEDPRKSLNMKLNKSAHGE
jgi:hypothetical protein